MATDDTLAVCTSCDAVWAVPPLAEGARVRCHRCGDVIAANDVRGFERSLAALMASFILIVAAVCFPFLSMESAGLSNQISILDAVIALDRHGMHVLAITCALFILIIPFCHLMLLITVISVSRSKVRTPVRQTARLYRFSRFLEPWSMAEIFLIGVVVSLVKVTSLATVTAGPAFWALSGLVFALTYTQATNCRHSTWVAIRGTA